MQSSQLRMADAILPALLISTLLALFTTARAGDETSVSILYHESIQLIDMDTPGQELVTGVEIAPLTFDAYGRRFELLPDDKRSRRHRGRIQLHGRLAGLTGSWFSLLRNGNELSGIISDGTDIYLIEPHRRIAKLLIEPPGDGAPANLIFRLADTLVPQGMLACATHDDSTPTSMHIDGQSAVNKLSAELQAISGTASATTPLPLLTGVVADESFVEEHGIHSEGEIDAIFITAQGILFQETGIEVQIDSVRLVMPDDLINPFSDTVVGPDLLDELGIWRSRNQAHLGHTHLLTSREKLLNSEGEEISGISYLGKPGSHGACNPRTGASLSRDNPELDANSLTALIVVHEIGHNLGAPHDGDPDGACASASPTEFIMAPKFRVISPATNVEFSDCSIMQMDKFITAASCLNEDLQTSPANSGGGGGAFGWLSVTGLLFGPLLRRRRLAQAN